MAWFADLFGARPKDFRWLGDDSGLMVEGKFIVDTSGKIVWQHQPATAGTEEVSGRFPIDQKRAFVIRNNVLEIEGLK